MPAACSGCEAVSSSDMSSPRMRGIPPQCRMRCSNCHAPFPTICVQKMTNASACALHFTLRRVGHRVDETIMFYSARPWWR
ncbi:hypothetical protein APHAL10511_005556 [Amanita phalloides]|nr:hypothetical protein APHAL10511_005556 [Amanita phalloides]